MGKYYNFYSYILLVLLFSFTTNIIAQSGKTVNVITLKTDDGRTVIEQALIKNSDDLRTSVSSYLSKMKAKEVENINVSMKLIKESSMNGDKQLFLTRSKAISGINLRYNAAEDADGPAIRSIVVGSPADKAGLRKGDIITQVAGQQVRDLGKFMNILCPFEAGDPIDLTVIRNGETMEVDLVLDERIIKYLDPEQMELDYKTLSGAEVENLVNDELWNNDRLYEISLSWGQGDDQSRMIVFNLRDDRPKENKNDFALLISDLSIAPNPTNGRVYISFSMDELAGSEVIILDALGKEVYQEKLTDGNNFYNQIVDLSSHPKGFYFLRISQNNKMINKKIVVQ